MVMHTPGAPQYACRACHHRFRRGLLDMLLGRRKPRCPKCGSEDISLLVH